MPIARRCLATTLLGLCGAAASQTGYTAWDVQGNDILVRMDLSTGVGTRIGNGMGFADVDGLAFDAQGRLWAADDSSNRLLLIDIGTGVARAIGGSFGSGFNDMGLAFGSDGTLYMSVANGSNDGRLFTVDTTTGAATEVGDLNPGSTVKARSLAFMDGVLYGWSSADTLLRIDTSTGAAAVVGAFGFPRATAGHDGMDADPATGLLWALSERENRSYTLDIGTGVASIVASSLTCDGAACYTLGGFSGLAIAAVPEPDTVLLWTLGLIGLWRIRRV